MDWNEGMNVKTIQKLVYFYVTLLMIAGIVVGSTINRIELHMVVRRVIAGGVDYDAFREMVLSDKMIQSVKRELASSQYKTKSMNAEVIPSLNSIDSLTLYMMVNRYNLNKSIKISKKNITRLLNSLSQNASFLELKEYYKAILCDIICFPVPDDNNGDSTVVFEDSWNSYRSYGGNRRHEGTDLMPEKNIRGFYQILSMTDGSVEKMGWLDKGGYRIGIRGNSGAYYYYAHLDSYAPGLQVGDFVKAGQFIGYMGDSGYGKEGTTGKFDVHLHLGIYVNTSFGEISVNPYWVLRYLEKK